MASPEIETRPSQVEDRCRLVLIVPALAQIGPQLNAALGGGDVASIILIRGEMSEGEYHRHVSELTPLAQEFGVAVIVEDDSQAMGRSGADGIMISGEKAELDDAIARFSPKRIVGCANIKTRHQAMEQAETGPDFLFIGKCDGDIRPEAHPRNVKLGAWCAEVMQISVIVMGGNDLESVVEVAQGGVEFVGLSKAVFDHPQGPAVAVREANRLLDENAPRFEDENA